MILKTQTKTSPTSWVDLISLRMKMIVEPRPAKTKCKKIVIVYPTFSDENKKDITYEKGITPIGYRRKSNQVQL